MKRNSTLLLAVASLLLIVVYVALPPSPKQGAGAVQPALATVETASGFARPATAPGRSPVDSELAPVAGHAPESPEPPTFELADRARHFAEDLGAYVYDDCHDYAENALLNPSNRQVPPDVLAQINQAIKVAEEMRLEQASQINLTIQQLVAERMNDGLKKAWPVGEERGAKVCSTTVGVNGKEHTFTVHVGDSPYIDDLMDVRNKTMISANREIALLVLNATSNH